MTWDEVKSLHPNKWVLLKLLDARQVEYDDYQVDYESFKKIKNTKTVCTQIDVVIVIGEELTDADLKSLDTLYQKLNEEERKLYCLMNTKWDHIIVDS